MFSDLFVPDVTEKNVYRCDDVCKNLFIYLNKRCQFPVVWSVDALVSRGSESPHVHSGSVRLPSPSGVLCSRLMTRSRSGWLLIRVDVGVSYVMVTLCFYIRPRVHGFCAGAPSRAVTLLTLLGISDFVIVVN